VRTLVSVGAGASLTLGQLHLGLGDGGYLVNAVTEVDLGEGAALALGKAVEEGVAGSHLEAVHVRALGRASFRSFTLSLSGARVRTGITVTLAGAGASAEVDGLYLGRGRQKLDHVTDIRHAVGDTRSSETWSGVLDERSEGGFQGVVRIDRDAMRSATRQLTRTLLLSSEAEAHAKPELHIDCDEVEASHGATVGQLDAMEQFYLASRGIAPEDARKMLIRAFVQKQLAFAPEALRPTFAAALAGSLGGGESWGDDV
jgi:Fe-S cluster assembly protein SufD